MAHLKQTQTGKRYLLVSRIGRKSLHNCWLGTPDSRNFDVLLSAYDLNVPRLDSDEVHFEYRKGPKVEGYNRILQEHRELLRQYHYVGFFDEDLKASTDTLNTAFRVSEELNVKISQPSLTWNSHFTYAALLRQPGLSIRYINFIEMMCPIFRQDILWQVAPLFSLGVESGIDLIWCNLVKDSPQDFAVLDCAPIRHTEPVGGQKSANGFVDGKDYEDDIHQILQTFNLPWLSCVPYAAMTASGKKIQSRTGLLLFALSLVFSIPLNRLISLRLRAVAEHLMHVLMRDPINIQTQLPGEAMVSISDHNSQH